MATETDAQAESQLHAASNPDQPADGSQKPPVKRSWRRKYRKMRAKFEETIGASNRLIMDEWKAQALARRLREQNDQILDILLDMNESARLPANLRFDLREGTQSDPADSSLAAEPAPEITQQKLHELRTELADGTITAEDYAQKADQLHNSQAIQHDRNLTSLEAKVPCTTDAPDPPIEGIDLTDTAPGYMSPAHEEEYLLAMDVALADPSYNPDAQDGHAQDGRALRISTAQPPPSEKDLTIRNPDSVYNWLRKHQPQVFLQDKDPHNPENLSEKSSARTGNTGGRGKRQSAISGTPGPKTDQDEDDIGFVPETGTSGGKGRKGKVEDDAYRPKGGSSRGAKRKREDGDPVGKGGRKKNRASGGTAS